VENLERFGTEDNRDVQSITYTDQNKKYYLNYPKDATTAQAKVASIFKFLFAQGYPERSSIVFKLNNSLLEWFWRVFLKSACFANSSCGIRCETQRCY
jgi:hypothetical protein